MGVMHCVYADSRLSHDYTTITDLFHVSTFIDINRGWFRRSWLILIIPEVITNICGNFLAYDKYYITDKTSRDLERLPCHFPDSRWLPSLHIV